MALDAALATATLLLLVVAQNPGERAKAETGSKSVTAFLEARPDFFRREARGGAETSLYDAIMPPTNGMNLLRNLKFALDHDVVLRRDFLEAETLRRFFGMAPNVHRRDDGSLEARWSIRPSDAELARLDAHAAARALCRYAAGWRQSESGKRSGWIGIGCNYSGAAGPTFEEVELVFGPGWMETRGLSGQGLELPLPGAPRGNARLTYVFDKGLLRRSILVAFRPDGSFGSIDLAEKEY